MSRFANIVLPSLLALCAYLAVWGAALYPFANSTISAWRADLRRPAFAENSQTAVNGMAGTPDATASGGYRDLSWASTRSAGHTHRAKRKEPATPVSIPDLFATVLMALGIDATQPIVTPIGRPVRYSEGKPVLLLLADTP